MSCYAHEAARAGLKACCHLSLRGAGLGAAGPAKTVAGDLVKPRSSVQLLPTLIPRPPLYYFKPKCAPIALPALRPVGLAALDGTAPSAAVGWEAAAERERRRLRRRLHFAAPLLLPGPHSTPGRRRIDKATPFSTPSALPGRHGGAGGVQKHQRARSAFCPFSRRRAAAASGRWRRLRRV